MTRVLNTEELRRRAEAELEERGSGLWKCGERAEVDHELEVYAVELEMQNESLLESRVQVEEGLQRYADLYDFAPVAYFTLERDGAIRELNLAGAALLGTERSRLVGRRLALFIAESSRVAFHLFLEGTFSSGEKRTCAVEVAIDGRPKAAVSISATVSSSGTECRAVAVDVTERKHDEDMLRASEERFRLLVEAVHDCALYLVDLDGRVESWNAGAAAVIGYAEPEVVGQPVSLFYAAEDREKPALARRFAASAGRFEDEGWCVRKHGSRFWARTVVTPVRDLNGQVARFACVTRDLSERRAAEARFQVVEAAPDGILVVGGCGAVVRANPRAEALFGYSPGELVGTLVADLVPERFRNEHRSRFASFVAAPRLKPTGIPASRLVGMRKDGSEFHAAVSLGPAPGPEGGLILAFIRDISSVRRLELEKARLHEITAALSRTMSICDAVTVILTTVVPAVGARSGVVARVVDSGRKIEILSDLDPADTEVLVGLSRARPERLDGRSRLSIDVRSPVCDAARGEGAVWLECPAEIRRMYPDHVALYDKTSDRAIVALPLLSRDGVIGVVRLAFADERTFATEERDFLRAIAELCAQALDRAQLFEDTVAARDLAERAARMRDEFLSIVAHDIGNPLHAASLWATQLRRNAPPGAEGAALRKGMVGIEKSIRAMATLVEDLHDVDSLDAGRLRIQMLEQDVAAIVTDTVDAFGPLCNEKRLSIVGSAPPLLRLSCDAGRVQQALGNLVGNAIKFTPVGGKIVVLAKPVDDGVRFSVSDTGAGLSDEALEHVFERYWRGKDRDLTKGIGLGLFIAKGIVEGHGGKMWAESVLGSGSTFSFTLPATGE